MAQHDYVIANGTGAAVRSDLNNALAAIVSQNSGATAPATTYAFQFWADTTTGLLKLRNSANSAWVTLFQLDGEWSTLPVENGTAAAPSIYFKDSGTDTGFYSPGTDQIGISTAGTSRLTIDANGNLAVDTNTLYVDAPNNRVGIGTSSPSWPLHLATGATAGSALFASTNTTAYSGTAFNTSRVYLSGGAGTGAYNSIGFSNSSNAEGLIGFVQNASGYGDFVVQSYAGSYGEKLRVTSAGNVGIGSTTLIERLHVNGGVRLDVNDQGLYFNSSTTAITGNGTSSYIAFNTSNAEKARLDSSGRWLLGASSTSEGSTLLLQGYNGGTAGAAILRLCTTSATPADGGVLGYVIFGDSAHKDGAWIRGERDGGTWSTTSKPTRLVFSTTADGASSPTERMRIGNDGRTSTFCSSTTNNLALAHAAGAGTTYKLIEGAYGATGVNTGTESFRVYTNGNVQNTNNSYTAISDIKLKENIVDANSQWDDIKALQVRNYNLKDGQTHRQIGLIAQEVEPISPGLVYESPDRDEDGNDLGTVTKSVNYSVLYMKAVKALQEAMERIETLEAKVAALESA